MQRDNTLMLYSFLKSGNTQAASDVILRSLDANILARLNSLPANLIASIGEDEFLRWSESSFAGSAMPNVPLKSDRGSLIECSSCLHTGK